MIELLTATESDGSTMLIVLCIKRVLDCDVQFIWKINDLMRESSRMVCSRGPPCFCLCYPDKR